MKISASQLTNCPFSYTYCPKTDTFLKMKNCNHHKIKYLKVWHGICDGFDINQFFVKQFKP